MYFHQGIQKGKTVKLGRDDYVWECLRTRRERWHHYGIVFCKHAELFFFHPNICLKLTSTGYITQYVISCLGLSWRSRLVTVCVNSNVIIYDTPVTVDLLHSTLILHLNVIFVMIVFENKIRCKWHFLNMRIQKVNVCV